MSWLEELGYRRATAPPSVHGDRCAGYLLIAQENEDDSSLFLYCPMCKSVWLVDRYASKMHSRRYTLGRFDQIWRQQHNAPG